MIHGSCSDYRAAASIDLEHDAADIDKKVACRTLAFWGAQRRHAQVLRYWRSLAQALPISPPQSLPGGHFFIDQLPAETAQILATFLKG